MKRITGQNIYLQRSKARLHLICYKFHIWRLISIPTFDLETQLILLGIFRKGKYIVKYHFFASKLQYLERDILINQLAYSSIQIFHKNSYLRYNFVYQDFIIIYRIMESIGPKRFLHWVFRIKNLKDTLEVLSTKLCVKVQRHQQFALKCDATCNGNYQNPWSKTMAALGSQKSHFALQLVQNYGVVNYESNDTHFQNLEFFDPDYNESLDQFHLDNSSYKCLKYGSQYFSNYSKLSPQLKEPSKKDYSFVTINVKSLQNSRDYYQNLLKFKVYAEWKGQESIEKGQINKQWIQMNKHPFIIIGYGPDQTKIKLIQTGKDVTQTQDSGRMAFTTPQSVQLIKEIIEESEDKIEHQPVTLQTPGKADVIVIILKDRDGYEICFVEELGFHDLCTTKPGDDLIDWDLRQKQLEKLNAMKKVFGNQ